LVEFSSEVIQFGTLFGGFLLLIWSCYALLVCSCFPCLWFSFARLYVFRSLPVSYRFS
jgi:hypothetical protein